MKTAILAGGFGTRLSEETSIKPKPMVEIGGKPILWHIMKIYSHYGFNDFVILLGYKGYIVKEYFSNYFLHQSDVTIDLKNNKMDILYNFSEPWKITLLDTGDGSQTGGRILRAREYLRNEAFMLTYGDGVSDVPIDKVLAFHKSKKGIATMTSVLPGGRYGSVDADTNGKVNGFLEKPRGDRQRINGGFFVLEPDIFDYIEDDSTVFEKSPLESLVSEGKLYAFNHNGFWKCMDTLSDKSSLEMLWNNDPPWRIWS